MRALGIIHLTASQSFLPGIMKPHILTQQESRGETMWPFRTRTLSLSLWIASACLVPVTNSSQRPPGPWAPRSQLCDIAILRREPQATLRSGRGLQAKARADGSPRLCPLSVSAKTHFIHLIGFSPCLWSQSPRHDYAFVNFFKKCFIGHWYVWNHWTILMTMFWLNFTLWVLGIFHIQEESISSSGCQMWIEQHTKSRVREGQRS